VLGAVFTVGFLCFV